MAYVMPSPQGAAFPWPQNRPQVERQRNPRKRTTFPALRYRPATERRHNRPSAPNMPTPSVQRTWVGGFEQRYTTFQEACYLCHVAVGAPWQQGTVDVSCDAHFTPCTACQSADTCGQCGGLGEKLPRNLMAHRMLSTPGCAGDHNQLIGFVLPIVEGTDNAYWLAQAVEATLDMDGMPLTCQQLLLMFESLTTLASTYEPCEPAWHLAGIKIINLVSSQLRAALPEGCQ